MLVLVLLFALALAAGLLGGIVGTGSSLVLLPALVLCYGPRTAVRSWPWRRPPATSPWTRPAAIGLAVDAWH